MAQQSGPARTENPAGGSRSTQLGERLTLDLPQGRVQYRERGRGPTLLFVHGLYVTADLWRRVVPLLSGRYRCIAVDWPFGSHAYPMAEDADLSPVGVADLIADVIAALELSDVTVVANDTGIGFTQVFVARHPDKLARLVLTPGDVAWNFLALPIKWMRPLSRVPGGIHLIVRFWNSRFWRPVIMAPLTIVRPEPEVLDSWFRPATRSPGLRRDLATLFRGARPGTAIAALRELHRFTGRSVIFWNATGDLLFPRRHASVLQAALVDARIEMIPSSRAFIPEDQPAWLADAIDRFMTSTGTTGRRSLPS